MVFCNDARTRTFLAVAAEAAGIGSSGSSSDELSRSSSGEPEGSSGRDAEGAVANGAAGANGAAASTAARHPRRPNYSRQLVQMCHAVSGVFAAHGLPRFYADPQPHTSSECHHLGLCEGHCKVNWLFGFCRTALQHLDPRTARRAAFPTRSAARQGPVRTPNCHAGTHWVGQAGPCRQLAHFSGGLAFLHSKN